MMRKVFCLIAFVEALTVGLGVSNFGRFVIVEFDIVMFIIAEVCFEIMELRVCLNAGYKQVAKRQEQWSFRTNFKSFLLYLVAQLEYRFIYFWNQTCIGWRINLGV